MRSVYSKFLLWPFLGLLVLLFQNCKSSDLTSAGFASKSSDATSIESVSGNGTSYDGKPVVYLSQKRLECGGTLQPEKTLQKNLDGGVWQLRTIQNSEGKCLESEASVVTGAESFDVSQLAVFKGEYFDRVLNSNEAPLDNHGVGTVCRVRGEPVPVGQSKFEGLVIYWDDSLQQWASRLDYGYYAQGERYLSVGPIGIFQQLTEYLRFDSSALSGPMIPSYYSRQKLLIDFNRPADVSLRNGDGFYDGVLNYSFRVYNSVPPYVMTDVPLRCFVDVR